MVAFLQETGRSFPNPISSEQYTRPFKRPSSSKYESHDKYPNMGTGTDYYIQFEKGGPGSKPLGSDTVHYLGDTPKIDVRFDSSGNIVVAGGTCDLGLTLQWDDNTGTAGTTGADVSASINGSTISVSHGSGEKGSDRSNLVSNVGPGTYSTSISSNYGRSIRDDQICFYDDDGNDCNATLSIRVQNQEPTPNALSYATHPNFERQAIYRFFRGAKNDHKYSDLAGMSREDFGCENEDWSGVARGYNKEPRDGRPSFYLMNKEVTGSSPIKLYYSYWPDNTVLHFGSGNPSGITVGCGRNKYKYVKTIGYGFATESAAGDFKGSTENAVPLYHYRKGVYQNGQQGKDIDDLYTIDPASEVNLSGGPIAPKDALSGEYVYQGILCYIFASDVVDAPTIEYVEGTAIGPTGQCVDKTDWYDYGIEGSGYGDDEYRRFDPASYANYVAESENSKGYAPTTPGTALWNSDNVTIQNEDAHFEWFYGLNGAVKAALPRYLGFEDAYDSQFMFYLYDTSYPWNGPIYGIQYTLNDVPCCPNTTIPGQGEDDDEPGCVPHESYHSHFYEIKRDAWETTKTRLKINDGKEDVNANFTEIDTLSPRILFRYTSRDGDWNRGDTINGWFVNAVFYYGDELKVGVMHLSGNGNDFTYNSAYTSTDGGAIRVLAGYGIPNKAAFAGVYEFPKKISYWKVEISPNALIPNRTLDEAVLKAYVNKKGEVSEIEIINSGRGYENPLIKVINPGLLEDFNANDTAKIIKAKVGMNADFEKAIENPNVTFSSRDIGKDSHEVFGIKTGQFRPKNKNKSPYVSKEAVIEVTKLTDEGGIDSVRIIDGGSGYSSDEIPDVLVADPEYIKYDSPPQPGKQKNRFNKSLESMGAHMAASWSEVQNLNSLATSNKSGKTNKKESGLLDTSTEYTQSSVNFIRDGISVEIPDSYIRVPQEEISEDELHMCFDLPATCIKVDARTNLSKALPKQDQFSEVSKFSTGISEFEKEAMPYVARAGDSVDAHGENMSHLYAPFGKDRCIKMGQPKLYNIQRWFEMPCPYLAQKQGGDENLGEGVSKKKRKNRKYGNKQRAYGYLPYQYCASKEESASFTVSMEFEGRTIGSQGEAFMNYLNRMPKPKLAPVRKVTNGKKTWNCNDGDVEGRCYHNDDGDVVFVAIGGDENTYDYNSIDGYSEYDQFQTWLQDNLTSQLTPTSAYWTFTTTTTTPGSGVEGDPDYVPPVTTTTTDNEDGVDFNYPYTAFSVDCSTPYPAHECWDTYAGSNGPLNVYCGYDRNGTGIPGKRWWEITAFNRTNPFCTSCPPVVYGSAYAFFNMNQGSGASVGLTYVNDASIAINPQRMTEDDELNNKKRMVLGPYDGKVTIRNWLTGGTIALGRSINNFGNPFFDECSQPDEGSAWTDGQTINEEF